MRTYSHYHSGPGSARRAIISYVLASVFILITISVFPLTGANADAESPGAVAAWEEKQIGIAGTNSSAPDSAAYQESDGGVEDEVVYEYFMACLDDVGAFSVRCMTEQELCGAGAWLGELHWASNPAEPVWVPTGTTRCIYDAAVDFPGYTINDFRSVAILAAASGVQPSPHTLVGAQTNMYALAESQSFTETVAGFSVRVNAVPSGFSWDYGDGSSLGPIQEPGGPLPPERWGEETVTSHVYTETGDFAVVLTTYFTGEYSVDGGPWLPIPGQAAVPSEPVTVSVWRAVTNNYAENCLQNPRGAGC